MRHVGTTRKKAQKKRRQPCYETPNEYLMLFIFAWQKLDWLAIQFAPYLMNHGWTSVWAKTVNVIANTFLLIPQVIEAYILTKLKAGQTLIPHTTLQQLAAGVMPSDLVNKYIKMLKFHVLFLFFCRQADIVDKEYLVGVVNPYNKHY